MSGDARMPQEIQPQQLGLELELELELLHKCKHWNVFACE
jgi:hypothetical protein